MKPSKPRMLLVDELELLAQRLQGNDPPPVGEVLRILRQTIESFDAALMELDERFEQLEDRVKELLSSRS